MVREARYLAKINHPNIIRYFNSWIELKAKAPKTEKKQSTAAGKGKNSPKNSSELSTAQSSAQTVSLTQESDKQFVMVNNENNQILFQEEDR